SGRVFLYDPVADSITSVPSNWPPGDNGTLPGGFTVFNNKLYTLGGFDIPNGSGIDQIWEFTPNPAGWVQKNAVLPFPLGYIPTTTIGNLIYTGGGVDITGGVLTDTNHAFIYDPVADSISINTDIPDANANGNTYSRAEADPNAASASNTASASLTPRGDRSKATKLQT